MGRAVDKSEPEYNWGGQQQQQLESSIESNNNNNNSDCRNTLPLSFDAPASVGDFVLWTRIKRDLCCSTTVAVVDAVDVAVVADVAGLIKSKIRLSIEQKRSMSRAGSGFVCLACGPGQNLDTKVPLKSRKSQAYIQGRLSNKSSLVAHKK